MSAAGDTLSLEGLVIARGGRDVVRDVSIEVTSGEVTALLGPNGAGKSSMVLAIGGVLPIKAGTVRIGDEVLSGRRPEQIRRAGLAIVPEGRRLLSELTVEENLRVATYSLSASEARAGRGRALELFPELEKRLTTPARSLSGGEQQMVVLAQALVSQPRFLLIDELSLGLAPVIVSRLIPVLRTVVESGVGILLIEQFAPIALGLANRAYVMEGGRIQFEGHAKELQDNPELLHSAYLLHGSDAAGVTALSTSNRRADDHDAVTESHDYVIVGAGSAGCVLAARLSEDPDVSVTLLEAGGEDTQPEIHIPAAFPALLKSELDWDLLSEPEPGLDGRRLYLPRGRMLGGCSSINAMIYVRGNRLDYDAWADAGHEGWGFDDVLPYFRRSEDNERGESPYHGVDGPLSVSDGRSLHPLVDTMLEAARMAGHEANPDFNGARQEGVGRFQLTQRGGMRCSTADAFLRPAERRRNLTVIPRAMALRVVFEGKRAVGVEIDHDGRVETVRAEREVVICAGAYHSPVLLMLSGIGPEDQLAPLGIAIREVLPVGENLQDHYMAQLNYLTDEPSLLTATTPENFALLAEQGRGPLSSNIPEGAGFFRARAGVDAPDVEFHFAPSLLVDEGLTAPVDHGYCFGPVVIKPTSRGRVMLRSPVASAKPRVLSNFLTTDEDRASMLAGLKLAMEIAQQAPLRAVERAPFSVPDSTTDADLMAFARRAGQTVYHPTSTCAIGTVVDTQLRVYGCDGLRVVDASVMPEITRGNTNAPTIMIAERAADLIRSRRPTPALAAAT